MLSEHLGRSFGVSKLPYAALIDETGKLSATGLINTREHLESLFVAKESGVANIQQFLRSLTRGVPLRENSVAQFDRLTEKVLRGFASRTSRRSVFSLLGGMLAGAASLPLLPVAKGADGPPANPNDPNSGEPAAQTLGQSAGSGRSDQVRLLALLRHRRLALLLLRRHRHQLPARHRDVADHLDRHLPQSRRSAQLHHLVQRLLRRRGVGPLRLSEQQRRPAGGAAADQQRGDLVLRHQEPVVHLHRGSDPGCGY